MPIRIEQGKMFGWIDETWNPVVGCMHNCSYCWARKMALGLKRSKPRYRTHGFKPQLIEHELKHKSRHKTIFVSSMGDLFGDWVDSAWIKKVLASIKNSPTSKFLLLTKNPKRFRKFGKILPDNVIIGATIETNRNYVTNTAAQHPPQSRRQRYLAMKKLDFPQKFVAIEPLMDFDPKVFERWIREIKPKCVSISYDNYRNNLRSPELEKAIGFCKRIARFTTVLPHGEWVMDPSTRKRLKSRPQ